MLTFEELKKNEQIKTYIEQADKSLIALGFTEHCYAHVLLVAERAKYILETMGFDAHMVELVQIAAYLHDIGNLINRSEHAQSSAIMAFRILSELGMDAKDIALIVSAIGNHDEETGIAVNPIAAALIIADKSDVRRSRVRNRDQLNFDIHDRVNFSATKSKLKINEDRTLIKLKLDVNTGISSVMDYFQIFLTRMTMCRKAAETLGLQFKLIINEQQLI